MNVWYELRSPCAYTYLVKVPTLPVASSLQKEIMFELLSGYISCRQTEETVSWWYHMLCYQTYVHASNNVLLMKVHNFCWDEISTQVQCKEVKVQ